MKSFFAIVLGIFLVACAKSPDPKSPTEQGKTCGSGTNAIVCGSGDICAHPYVAPDVLTPANVRPEDPAGSHLDGPCGGIAGFHCADGLSCAMTGDQQYVADGMGTCALPWICKKGCF